MKKEFNPFQMMIDNAEGLTLTMSPGNLRSSLPILYIYIYKKKNKCEGNESSRSILKVIVICSVTRLYKYMYLISGYGEIISQVFHGILSALWNIQCILEKISSHFYGLWKKKIIFPSKLYIPLYLVSLLIVF